MEHLIGSFDTKTGHEQVRVYIVNGNGKTLISARVYNYRKCDWRLSKKGVTIPGSKVYKMTKLMDKAAEFISSDKFQSATA